MKRIKLLFNSMLFFGGAFFLSMQVNAADQLAFPEALGFGRYATGGRNGSVYHVTNLNDSGTGSFRDAVSSGNRIVVFDVGGYVKLETAVQIKSNITIAGQTAPGDGIGFEGGKLSCGSQSNIIIRHIRVRPGSETASEKDDGINMYRSQNCIIDHCSVEFSPWNNIGGSGSNDYKSTDITFQYCLIADPINQQFGAHIESVNSQWTWYGNCFANTHNRNPLEKINDIFVNNVLYNYQGGYTTHTSTNFSHDIINNYFVGGPTTGSTDNTWFQVDKNQSIYYSGNMKDRNNDGVLNGAETTPYWYQGAGTILSSPWSEVTSTMPTISASSAFRMVASIAGAQPVDQLDALIWSQVQSVGTEGAMYTSQTSTGLDNNGYGVINGGTAATDSDSDGMPDYWELAFDLDPLKDDAMTIGSDGYANIENYINWLASIHEQVDANSSVSVSLADYSTGWSKVSPSYKVSNAKNGTVSLSGSTATFTPDVNFSGLASFDFTITGSDATSYTTTVKVLVKKGETIVFENPSLTKQGGGSSSQTIYTNESLTNFNFLWNNAATVEVSWSPSVPDGIITEINTSAKTITFSGTPTSCGTYSYVVSTVGATTTVTKQGTINVQSRSYVYLNESGSSSDWNTIDYWVQVAVPYDCDSAIVRTGEVNITSDIRSATFVETNGIFRIRTNVAVRELHLQGGMLKSYTSNPEFRLTASLLSVEQPSVFMCGSLDTSVFKLSGKMTGEGDITKTAIGIFLQNADASEYQGRWYLQAGTLRLMNASGLGINGVTISNGAIMDVDIVAETGSVTMESGAKLNLDANLTVSSALLGSTHLNKGTYAAADYPEYLSGNGFLIVTEEITDAKLISNDSLLLEVYPNPVNNILNVLLSGSKDASCELIITNSYGVMLKRLTLLQGNFDKIKIDMENYPIGVYFLNILYKNEIFIKKVIKF